MSKNLLQVVVFSLGLAALVWVAAGYLIDRNLLAASMTVLIATAYLAGAFELWRFHKETADLRVALADAETAQSALEVWLQRLPAALRTPVQLRLQGERVALPALLLTPYLVGLLVLLGMLGTLLGMLATLHGTGMALESTTELEAMRAALAAPVKGLGFAFGTSIAGVASSAMLGLLSALCRRDRLQSVQQLDALAAGKLRVHSRTHQQQQMLQLLQHQTGLMPTLIERLQVLASSLEQQQQTAFERQLQDQQAFQQHAAAAQTQLATTLQHALVEGVAGHAHASQAALQTQTAEVLAGMLQHAETLQQHIGQRMQQQSDLLAEASRQAAQTSVVGMREQADALLQRLQQAQDAQLATLRDADTQRLGAWTDAQQQVLAELAQYRQRDAAWLEERSRLLAAHDALLAAVNQATGAQHAAVEALVSGSAEMLEQAGGRFDARLQAEVGKLDTAAAQVSASVLEVAGLGEAFEHAMRLFGDSAGSLGERLQQIEAALSQAQMRSDEQLAYYVAQAREVVELSLLSQKQIIGELQQLPAARSVEV